MPKKILFVLPYQLNIAPSQRFRVEAFFPELKEAGFTWDVHCFLDAKTQSVLYKKGHSVQKAFGVIGGFIRRFIKIGFGLRSYDYVLVHREAAPIGPPIFEYIISRIWKKKMIYDFDDAIWIPTTRSFPAFQLKAFWKIGRICRWATTVSAGNHYLADFASRSGGNPVFVPTCVDTARKYNRKKETKSVVPVIGWTGSHSTMTYLQLALPVLQRLEKELPFRFLVISNEDPKLPLKGFEFIKWNAETEIEDILRMDIGIMPLIADAWSEGKCGFKIIQYLALGIPALASPVGVNSDIIEEGVNGFLCKSDEEWYQQLKRLITDSSLRERLGATGKAKIEAEYSIHSNKNKFISLFH